MYSAHLSTERPRLKRYLSRFRRSYPHHDALLLANHGAVAYGPDLQMAYDRMETLEHFAKITLVARMVGKPKELPAEAIEKLLDVRERSGYMPSEARTCQACGYLAGALFALRGWIGGAAGVSREWRRDSDADAEGADRADNRSRTTGGPRDESMN